MRPSAPPAALLRAAGLAPVPASARAVACADESAVLAAGAGFAYLVEPETARPSHGRSARRSQATDGRGAP